MAAALLRISGAPLADPGPAITRGMTVGVTEALQLLQSRIQPKIPIGVTEAARGSLAHEIRSAPLGLPVGVIGSPLKHVAVLNDGRRPGQKPPPVMLKGAGGAYDEEGPLVLWVRRKIRIDRVHTGGRKQGQAKTRSGKVLQRQPTVNEARSIAYLIARAIGARGTEGLHFFEKGIEESESALKDIFGRVGLTITTELASSKGTR